MHRSEGAECARRYERFEPPCPVLEGFAGHVDGRAFGGEIDLPLHGPGPIHVKLAHEAERLLDVLPGLRARHEPMASDRLAYVGGGGLDARQRGHVRLVDQDHGRDLAADAAHRIVPFREQVHGLEPRPVGHEEQGSQVVEERLLQELAEARVSHDVPDRRPDRHRDARVIRIVDLDVLRRYLRAERVNVLSIERVREEPPYEGGLPDAGVGRSGLYAFGPIITHANWASGGPSSPGHRGTFSGALRHPRRSPGSHPTPRGWVRGPPEGSPGSRSLSREESEAARPSRRWRDRGTRLSRSTRGGRRPGGFGAPRVGRIPP